MPDGVNVDGNPDLKAMQVPRLRLIAPPRLMGPGGPEQRSLSLATVGVLSLLAPTAAYFWFIQHYPSTFPMRTSGIPMYPSSVTFIQTH